MTKTIAIRPVKERVKETETFKDLSPIGQKLFIKKNNLVLIDHALKVIDNQGYEYWNEISNYSHRNKSVIDELVLIK